MQAETVKMPERQQSLAAALNFHERLALKNVLVPTDFSADSFKAVRYGAALAQKFDGELWLLHVVEPPPSFSGVENIPLVKEDSAEIASAEARISEFANRYIPRKVAVKSLVRHGSVVSEITTLSRAKNIDLVVISTHGRTGFARAVYGSMAERILHNAPCPILVVRDDEHDLVATPTGREETQSIALNRILVPVDFSDSSRKALRYAEAFAWRFGAQINCVHIVKHEQPLIVVETTAYRRDQERDAAKKMEALLKEIDPSLSVESSVELGAPDRKIVALAAEWESDLMILGQHCAGVKRFILGSTTDEVVKHAHCPVLVVRENEHDFIV